MDADGTHDPKYFKSIIKNAKKFDYVITSRFKKPNLIEDWPLFRKFITYTRHIFVILFLVINLDASGAFRGFYLNKICLKIYYLQKIKIILFWEVTYILKKEVIVYLKYQ